MHLRLAIALALSLAASSAAALETSTWPPPPEVLARMRDLQALLSSPDVSKEERAAARRELERLMKSPAGADQPRDATKKPARAAIDPYPSVGKSFEGKLPSPPRESPPTARLEVIPDTPPRRPVINPATGSVIHPISPGFAVDPRTGQLLHETPGGYIDPRTGQLIPK